MRIAHVTSWLSRHGAGVKNVVEHLSRAQFEQGHHVRVFGIDDCAWTTEDKHAWRGAPATALHVSGPQSFGYMSNLVPELKLMDADVVHLHGLWMYGGLAALKWHRATGRPYVSSIHGMLSPVSLAFSARKKVVAGHVFQKRVLRQAAFFHVTSDAEAADVRHYGLTNPIFQTKLGVVLPDLNEVRERPESPKVILALGRLHPQKGFTLLIEAWAALADTARDWELHIVGPDENDHKSELEAQVRAGGVPRVRIKEPVYGEEKYRMMQEAEVFALPSHGENFGLTVAESLACGTPVLVSKGAPWSELESRGCGLWVEQEADAWIAALRTVLHLPLESRQKMGELGRIWVRESFSWPPIAKNLLDQYHTASEIAVQLHTKR